MSTEKEVAVEIPNGSGTEQDVTENELAAQLRDVRFDGMDRKRYPFEWLLALRDLVKIEPKLSPEGMDEIERAKSAPSNPASPMIPARRPEVIPSRGPGQGPGLGQGDMYRRPSGDRGGKFRPITVPSRPSQQGMEPIRGIKHVPPPQEVVLKRGENAWKPSSEAESQDELDKKIKEIRSLLNKITLETFDRLYTKLYKIDVDNKQILSKLVEEIFEKALFEPNFVGMYADMCMRFHKDYKDKDVQAGLNIKTEGKALEFRRALLSCCRKEFLSTAAKEGGEEEAAPAPEPEEKLSEEDKTIKEMKAKRRMLGNVMFIGELFLRKLMTEPIFVKECVGKLVTLSSTTKDEDVIECLCKLMTTVGGNLSKKWAKSSEKMAMFNGYFAEFARMSNDRALPSRTRFMLKDLIDLRESNWEARKLAPQPKKISEIHEEARREEEAKNQRSNNPAGARDMRGGNNRRPYSANVNPAGQHHAMSRMTSHMQQGQMRSPSTRIESRLNQLGSRPTGGDTSNMPEVVLMPRSGNSWGSKIKLAPNGGRGAGSLGGPNSQDLRRQSTTTASRNQESADAADSPRRASTLPGSQVPEARPAPAPEVPELNEDLLERKSKNMQLEFYLNQDSKELKRYIGEVPKSQQPQMINRWFWNTFEGKSADREKLSGLLLAATDGENSISEDTFAKGLSLVVEMLEDLEMDAPNASMWVARLVAPVYAANVPAESILKIMDAFGEVPVLQKLSFFVNLFAYYGSARGDNKEADAKAMYLTTQLDLMAIATEYNEKDGPEKLKKMLEDNELTGLLEA